MTLYPSQDNLNKLIEKMYRFYTFSGLEVNYSKTVAFKLGSCRDIDAQHYSMKKINWIGKHVKILRIWYHQNSLLIHKYNFMDKLEKIHSIYITWKAHNLSLVAKITIINSLVMSQFQYQLAALPAPLEDFETKLKIMTTEFLWSSKPPRTKYDKIIQNY